jgi:hypothetical protein
MHAPDPHQRSQPLHRSPPFHTRTAARALDAAAVAALYQNCLKLASENKITAKNTWALPLIDHMADLVAAGGGGDGDGDGPAGGTDFQRASLTLAAGVSIYAHRVDAVHGDVFRILGGLGRPAGGEVEGAEQAGAVVADRGAPDDGQAGILQLLAHVAEIGVDDLAGEHLVAGADDLDAQIRFPLGRAAGGGITAKQGGSAKGARHWGSQMLR